MREINAELGKEMGADAYVVKPFSSSDLLGPVRDLLKGAQGSSNPAASPGVVTPPGTASRDKVPGGD